MPELPEVETVKKTLEPLILGTIINEVKVFYRPIVSNNEKFEKKVEKQQIQALYRKGKYLVFILDEIALVTHFRMEGKYAYRKSSDIFNKHEHVVFRLNNGFDLVYEDTRKFGRFEIKGKTSFLKELPLSKVAAEPFDIDINDFYKAIQNKRITIKSSLLDQHIVSGIGNIYANEILFRSKIHPATPSCLIDFKKSQEIIKHSIDVLTEAVNEGGSTIDSFEVIKGVHGRFQNMLKVHGRAGKPCPECGTTILKSFVNGRGTYSCPVCQKSFLIGLTGGIASGKTTASSYLKELGYKVIDSDDIVRNMYLNEKHVNDIAKILNIDANIMTKQMISDLIFSDKKALENLNAYIHPLVFKYIEDELKTTTDYTVFIDVPLLFEVGYDKKVDLTLLIDTNEMLQLKRLQNRNKFSEEKALSIIKAQMPLEEKRTLSDVIIQNNHTKQDLYEAINKFIKERYL